MGSPKVSASRPQSHASDADSVKDNKLRSDCDASPQSATPSPRARIPVASRLPDLDDFVLDSRGQHIADAKNAPSAAGPDERHDDWELDSNVSDESRASGTESKQHSSAADLDEAEAARAQELPAFHHSYAPTPRRGSDADSGRPSAIPSPMLTAHHRFGTPQLSPTGSGRGSTPQRSAPRRALPQGPGVLFNEAQVLKNANAAVDAVDYVANALQAHTLDKSPQELASQLARASELIRKALASRQSSNQPESSSPVESPQDKSPPAGDVG